MVDTRSKGPARNYGSLPTRGGRKSQGGQDTVQAATDADMDMNVDQDAEVPDSTGEPDNAWQSGITAHSSIASLASCATTEVDDARTEADCTQTELNVSINGRPDSEALQTPRTPRPLQPEARVGAWGVNFSEVYRYEAVPQGRVEFQEGEKEKVLALVDRMKRARGEAVANASGDPAGPSSAGLSNPESSTVRPSGTAPPNAGSSNEEQEFYAQRGVTDPILLRVLKKYWKNISADYIRAESKAAIDGRMALLRDALDKQREQKGVIEWAPGRDPILRPSGY